MTREEAIEVLQTALTAPFIYGAYADAIDMAIEALSEAQVDVGLINKDAVSREGLLKSWEELSPRGRTEFDQVIMTIPALPSAKGGDAQMNEVNPKQYMQQSPNGADLISRQDAINTLETEERNTDRAEDVSGLTLAKFLIDALPSADAKWVTVTKDGCNFPPYSEFVLVWVNDGHEIASYEYDPKAGADFWSMDAYELYDENIWKVKAWMPLPTPYKGGDDEWMIKSG